MRLQKFITYILMLLPIVICLIVFPFLPETVPVHFDINMQVDRMGSKYELLIISALSIIFVLILKYMSALASKQEGNGKNNEKIFNITIILVLILFNVINACLLFFAFNTTEGIVLNADYICKIILSIMGIMFIVMGNIMPKTKMNSVLGFRSCWSMKNEETWKRNQRFGGILLMIAGFIVFGVSIFTSGILCTCISTVVLLSTAIIILIHSYIMTKKY